MSLNIHISRKKRLIRPVKKYIYIYEKRFFVRSFIVSNKREDRFFPPLLDEAQQHIAWDGRMPLQFQIVD
jgi:hypothetical protein